MFFFQSDRLCKFDKKSIEMAYLSILADDLTSAGLIFNNIDSSRAKWGSFLIEALISFIIKKLSKRYKWNY